MKKFVFPFCSLFFLYCSYSVSEDLNTLKVPLQNASPDYKLSFPKDHGSHPNFKTEWWYFTGNLYDEGKIPFKDAPSFGYQLTFFRQNTDGTQGYLAHGAISDFKNDRHTFDSVKAPGIFDFAGASLGRLYVWNRNWFAETISDATILRAKIKDKDLALILDSAKTPLILQGSNGFSKKGTCETCASHYTSLTRIPTRGFISENNIAHPLSGISWMDHEFMTNTLESNQTGWDWFSLVSKENIELMLFTVRSADGKNDFLSGTCIKDGQSQTLSKDDFTVTPLEQWNNAGVMYPSKWKVESRKCFGFSSVIKTRIKKQLLEFPADKVASYYEGAVYSEDESVIGYVELTGYDKSITGAL